MRMLTVSFALQIVSAHAAGIGSAKVYSSPATITISLSLSHTHVLGPGNFRADSA